MAFEALRSRGYQIEFHSHAEAILTSDFPDVIGEVEQVLLNLSIPVEQLVAGGGGETDATQHMRRSFAALHWTKHNFRIEKTIDGTPRESISHEVDHLKTMPAGRVAMEIEWNNKDPFFDRDLDNFKRLHADSAISVGAILTRGSGLQADLRQLILKFAEENRISSYQDLAKFKVNPTDRQRRMVADRMRGNRSSFADAWSVVFCTDKYGPSTTHWRKLQDRVDRGVGNPCPLLLIGLPSEIVTFAGG